MARLSIVVLLFVTAFLMLKDFSATWQGKKHILPPAKERKVVQEKAALPGNIINNPTAPAVLPDLKPGYLFNDKRSLEEVVEEEKKEEAPVENEILKNDLGIDVKIDDLLYSGSIIGETFSRAIVTFPTPQKKKSVNKSKSSRSSRSTESRPSRASSRQKDGLQSAKLKKGDVLNGYVVADITPDKIIFDKDGDIIEKLLYDPSKKRVAPKNTKKAAPSKRAAPERRSKAPVPQQPAAVRSIPVPNTDPGQQRTVRKVVSRKPPEKPNTSRVSRRRRSTRGSIGGSTDIPTMPPMPPIPAATGR